MPDANTLTVSIFAGPAQTGIDHSRTKATLDAKRAQKPILGKPENMTIDAQLKGAAATRRTAMENKNNRMAPL